MPVDAFRFIEDQELFVRQGEASVFADGSCFFGLTVVQ